MIAVRRSPGACHRRPLAPKRGAEAETREGWMAKAFKGCIWVDEAAREVMRVEATAVDDLS